MGSRFEDFFRPKFRRGGRAGRSQNWEHVIKGGAPPDLKVSKPAGSGGVLRIFSQNFGDESQFWWILVILISTSKFWKSLVTVVTPILGQIFQNFDFEILVRSQSYNKPPWRNFDFLSNFEILAKIENLKSLTLAEIQILDPEP